MKNEVNLLHPDSSLAHIASENPISYAERNELMAAANRRNRYG